MKLILFAALSGLAAAAVALPIVTPPPVGTPPAIARAIAAPDRANQAATDLRRHPAELLAFAGVKPGDKVADLIPGSGYFTRIFSKVVGPKGQVYAVWPAEYAREAHPDPENSLQLAASPGYSNIQVLMQPASAFASPVLLDLVFTSQNYHDYPDRFMNSLNPSVLNKAVYKALKPGGVYLIVDHAAAAGSGMRDTDTLHRIDPETVKAQVIAAGFQYIGEIDVLRNPADDHTKLVFDKSIRGRTDQFVMKFRKP